MPEQAENNETAAPPKPKGNWDSQKVLLILALGILIGSLLIRPVIDYLLSHLSILMAIFIALFLFIVIAVLALPRVINYFARRYTGQEVDVEAAVGDIQAKANHIADTIAGYALAKADPEVRKNIQKDLPGILHYLVFSRLRNSGLRMLMTVFVAIGGLMGTILLYNQNQLLQKQNEKIDNQILLDEAARRSSLNFLLGNVLDQVNQELSDPENTKRRLSPQLIGRIASLSQSFQPYYFMEDGKMIDRPLSPERGALLLALVNSGIDTFTLDIIFKQTVLHKANLQGAILDSAYLKKADLSGVNLSNASLRGANLSETRLNHANLLKANLNGSKLFGVGFQWANLKDAFINEADLRKGNLNSADLEEAYFVETNLSGAKLHFANISGTYFIRTNFDGVMGLNSKELKSSNTIYQVFGLPDSLASLLETDIEKKPGELNLILLTSPKYRTPKD
ncbi:pentapeptide repeat-containing protein [Flavilitoribacter nigricans]|nr:pentapeptide repeat-containing protein [Flavilitoribacter nigricans]